MPPFSTRECIKGGLAKLEDPYPAIYVTASRKPRPMIHIAILCRALVRLNFRSAILSNRVRRGSRLQRTARGRSIISNDWGAPSAWGASLVGAVSHPVLFGKI